jgi:hypothetical protein
MCGSALGGMGVLRLRQPRAGVWIICGSGGARGDESLQICLSSLDCILCLHVVLFRSCHLPWILRYCSGCVNILAALYS